uniref:Uncharacterized protein n=1 Tax=Oryza rufipogon TaxID=4529 RepID=A0A0E0P573_ORYRU
MLSGEKYTAEKIEDDPTGCEVEWVERTLAAPVVGAQGRGRGDHGSYTQVHEECLHEPTLGIADGREVGKKVVVSLAARSPPLAMPLCVSVVGLSMTLAINREKRLRMEEADRCNEQEGYHPSMLAISSHRQKWHTIKNPFSPSTSKYKPKKRMNNCQT